MCGLCCLFVILIVTHASSATFKVFGQIGDNVTLPCRYDTQTPGGPSFCWGRAELPWSKCSDTILSAEDGGVSYRQSSRYQLGGRLPDGDVSLTIVHAQWGDAGVYGCRVEVPGWFNDHKVNIHLSLEEVPNEEEPAAKDWTTATTAAQETTSAPRAIQTDDGIFGSAITEEEPLVAETKTASGLLYERIFKDFFNTGNVCRVAVFCFLSAMVILLFAFRRRFTQRPLLKDVDAAAMENIYESVPMSGPWTAPREQRHLQNP